MNRRDVAVLILELRVLLAQVVVARAMDDEDQARNRLAAMDRVALPLPLPLRNAPAMDRYVGEPVRRRIEREGILATAEQLRAGTW